MTIAFTFPGQGSQTVGMGRALADAFPEARAVFDEVDDALGEKLSAIIFEGPIETLTLTENAQPALMAVSLAATRVLAAKGVRIERVAFVAGHSLGEYSALAAAGSLSVADAARLLRIRGRAMQEAVPVGVGAMAALLGLDLDAASAIAADAADGEVCERPTTTGQARSSSRATRRRSNGRSSSPRRAGARRAVLLPVSAPFHCALMAPAAAVMAEALRDVDHSIRRPCRVVANVTAVPTIEPETIRRNLVAQVTGMVRWRETIAFLAGAGVDTFVEVGAGKVLSGLAKRIADGAETLTAGTPEDIDAAVARLA